MIYSIIIPLGISIGWVIASLEENTVLKAVFLSISSGTLLFIVVLKCPIEEFLISRMKVVKAIGFILGVLMVMIFHFNELSNNN